MKIIGVTGGIGAGKSTVLSILQQEYHAYIVESDRVAHWLMEPGQPAYEQIIDAFPEEILDSEGKIHRGKLGSRVFQSPKQLRCLNGIVHPEVKRWILDSIASCREMGNINYFIVEAALLIEDGYTEICDELWYIDAPEELRIQRLMESRGYSRERCEHVIQNQSPAAFYREHCTHVIKNDGSLEQIKKQIEELLKNQ